MAINESKYKNLGKSFDGNSTPVKGIESALFRLSEDVSQVFRDYFKDNDLDATGALSNSIGGIPVKIFDNGAEISIVAEDYFKFLDEGVNGVEQGRNSRFSFKSLSPIPIQSTEQWFKARGITLLPQFKTYEQQAYAYAVSVKKKGIKPRKIIEGVEREDDLEQSIANSLEAALGNSVELTLTKITNDVNK